jgi:hypothetical protein
MEALDQKKLSDMVFAHIGHNIQCTGLWDLLTDDGKDALSEPWTETEDGEEYQQEPLEFWAVNTEQMERALTKHGEKVRYGIWCRTCSGQAIYMDSVMEEIAKEWRVI